MLIIVFKEGTISLTLSFFKVSLRRLCIAKLIEWYNYVPVYCVSLLRAFCSHAQTFFIY